MNFNNFNIDEDEDTTTVNPVLPTIPNANTNTNNAMNFNNFNIDEDEDEEELSDEEIDAIGQQKFLEKYYSQGDVPTLPPEVIEDEEDDITTDVYNLELFERIAETSLVYEQADELGKEFDILLKAGNIPAEMQFKDFIAKEPFTEIEKQRIVEKKEIKSNLNLLSKGIRNGDFGEFARVFDIVSGQSLSTYAVGLVNVLDKSLEYVPAGMGDIIEPIINALEKGTTFIGGDGKTLDPAFYFATVRPDLDVFDMNIDINPKQVTDNILKNMGKFLEYIENAPSAFGIGISFGGVARLIEGATAELRATANAKRIEILQKRGRSLITDLTRYDAQGAKVAAGNIAVKKAEEVAKIAAENKEIKEQLIEGFERNLSFNTGLTPEDANFVRISKVINGQRVLDEKVARSVGLDIMEAPVESIDGQQVRVLPFNRSKDRINAEQPLQTKFAGETFTSPMLIPEKLDAMVAIAVKYKEKYPDSFKNDRTVIDNLFNLAAKGEIDGQDLIDDLADVNLSFEDYVLTVVSSGSTAGKILQKLSMIKRTKTFTESIDAMKATDRNRALSVGKLFKRFENVRRGIIVSQIPTTLRNLSSGVIRAPLDFFTNVFETSIQAYENDLLKADSLATQTVRAFTTAPIKAGMKLSPVDLSNKKITFSDNYKQSFNQLRLMFDPVNAEEYTRLILSDPLMGDYLRRLLEGLNEMQEGLGKGKASGKGMKAADAVMTEVEDVVMALNIPNKWQENIIRSSYFLGDLERQFKNEWGIDLIPAINAGYLPEILKETSRFKPKATLYKKGDKLPKAVLYTEADRLPKGKKVGDVRIPAKKIGDVKRQAKSVEDMIKDATDLALDATYSNAPDFGPFEATRDLLVKSYVGTWIMPFPNFMFKSMEFVASGAIGANPMLRKVLFRGKGGRYFGTTFGEEKITRKDRRMLARNITGLSLFYAAYGLVKSDNSPEAVQEMYVGRDSEGNAMVADVTGNYPLRQGKYIAKAGVQFEEGGAQQLLDWYDSRIFADTFLGVNVRLGVGNSFVEEVAAMFEVSDLDAGDRMALAAGRFIGNYVQTFTIPYNQFLEVEKGLGMRDPNIKATKGEPVVGGKENFMQGFKRGFIKYGAPKDYNLLPDQVFIFGDKNTYNKITGGITGFKPYRKSSFEGEYLKYLGFKDFQLLDRQNKSGKRQLLEKQLLLDALDLFVDEAIGEEQLLREQYALRLDKSVPEEVFVKQKLRGLINGRIKGFRIENKVELDEAGGEWYTTFKQFKTYTKEERRLAILEVKENRAGAQQTNSLNIDLNFNDIDTIYDLLYAAQYIRKEDPVRLENQKIKSEFNFEGQE